MVSGYPRKYFYGEPRVYTVWRTSAKDLVAFVHVHRDNWEAAVGEVLECKKIASCCSNATMAGVLADFSTKARLVVLLYIDGAGSAADIDGESAPLGFGRPSLVAQEGCRASVRDSRVGAKCYRP